MRDAISANEFKGMVKGGNKKGMSSCPTVKAPKISKAAKQRLIPYGNQAPQRRANPTIA